MGKARLSRRAMRLHECATVLARDYDDQVPGDVETLLTLPGVGAYTARAIACFGYGQRVPVVDTNVRRVIARVVHGVADSALLGTRPARRRGTITNRERCPLFGGTHGVGRPGMHGPHPAMPDVSAELLRMA